jgi:hypothetical protein
VTLHQPCTRVRCPGACRHALATPGLRQQACPTTWSVRHPRDLPPPFPRHPRRPRQWARVTLPNCAGAVAGARFDRRASGSVTATTDGPLPLPTAGRAPEFNRVVVGRLVAALRHDVNRAENARERRPRCAAEPSCHCHGRTRVSRFVFLGALLAVISASALGASARLLCCVE